MSDVSRDLLRSRPLGLAACGSPADCGTGAPGTQCQAGLGVTLPVETDYTLVFDSMGDYAGLEGTLHGKAELLAVTDQISADQATFRKEGIELSSWAPDSATNTAGIALVDYSDAAAAAAAAAAALKDRYGDRISVATKSEGRAARS